MAREDEDHTDRVGGRTLGDLLDRLGIGAFHIDHTNGTITDGTHAFARMFGYDTVDALIGKPAVNHYADPKERAEAAARIFGHPDLARDGHIRFEARRLDRDGVPLDVLMALLPTYDGDGRVVGSHVLIERLGPRRSADKAFRLSEERFRIFFDTSPVGMALTTPDGRVVRANASLCAFLGRTDHALIGFPLATFMHRDDGDPVGLGVGDATGGDDDGREERDGVVGVERRFVHLDGRAVWGSVSASWLEDQGARHSRVVIVQDITRQKRLDEVLVRSQKMAAVGLLAGGIAHDFNNLLSAILGNLTLGLADHPAGDPAREPLENALVAATRARDLTQQLITFARGGSPVRRAASVIQIARDTARLALSGRNASIELAHAIDLWGVEVDPGQVSQLFQNLWVNAAEAMPGGGTISVRAENVRIGKGGPVAPGPGRYVRVDVTDHGIGIPEPDLARIFEPYFSTKALGRGLGLPAVLSIAERHGGHVDVQSQLGKGTTFAVYLPALAADTTPASAMAAAPIKGLAGVRVLVMDDEESVRMVAAACLRRAGAVVETVDEGERAVSAYARARTDATPFEVVLLDLTVRSGVGGIEAARRICDRDPTARCVVMSGYSDDPVLADFRTYGFVGVVPKPFTYQQLVTVVGEVVLGNRGAG